MIAASASPWQLALDQRRSSGLAEPGERARHLFFRRIVRGHDGGGGLDADGEVRGLSGHHPAMVGPHGPVDRHAPIIELRHARSSRSLRKEVADADERRAGFSGATDLAFENLRERNFTVELS